MSRKFYCIGKGVYEPLSPVPPHSFDVRELWTIVTLFNSGRHLYIDLQPPRWYEAWEQPLIPLRYKDFCGSGKTVYGIRIQHLGHIFGVHGGDARTLVTFGMTQWNITLVPCRLYTLTSLSGHQTWFRNRRVSVLPKQLLPLE